MPPHRSKEDQYEADPTGFRDQRFLPTCGDPNGRIDRLQEEGDAEALFEIIETASRESHRSYDGGESWERGAYDLVATRAE